MHIFVTHRLKTHHEDTCITLMYGLINKHVDRYFELDRGCRYKPSYGPSQDPFDDEITFVYRPLT